MAKRVDISTLFVESKDGLRVSYLHIFRVAKQYIWEYEYTAATALHEAYKFLLNLPPLRFKKININENPVMVCTKEYKPVSSKLLGRLQKECRMKKDFDFVKEYQNSTIEPEMARGVDIETLKDIGYIR